MPLPDDDVGALEHVRARLYEEGPLTAQEHAPLKPPVNHELPHAWADEPLPEVIPPKPRRHMRIASIFFAGALLFFLIALVVAGYLFYFGGNSVSSQKISVDVQGPTTIASGDVVPLLLTITNKNPVALDNTMLEVDFPESTRDANNVLAAYPHYTENLGHLASGAVVTRSLNAIIFSGAGQAVTLPISLSYGIAQSNTNFIKRDSYTLNVSSAPLEVSVGALTETVSDKPITFTLTVRSNATAPIDNVVLTTGTPFGFSVTSSSIPLTGNSFLLGTLKPGETREMTLVGTLRAQDNEKRVFHFSVGTAKAATDQTLAVTYMTQDATIAVKGPFISTNLALNGDTSANTTLAAGATQSVTLSYANSLPTNISNVTVSIALSGTGIDYNSIQTTRGFYRSLDHTVVFSPDSDPSLTTLAPGASGLGAFTFRTLAPGSLPASPTVTFTTSVSGTRVGESNVPESVQASMSKTVKVLSSVALSAAALHAGGPITNTGPIPPKADQATTYSVVWNVKNQGSAVANSVVTAALPSYVTYTNKTAGSGTFSYDPGSRTVTWNIGELAQGASVQGAFQVSLTPSSVQKGTAPQLTKPLSFTGHDRFAGVDVQAGAEPATTETKSDPGYVPANGTVQ